MSGYILIPKTVVLEKDVNTKKLKAEAKVKFADYANSSANYNVSVDNKFEITNSKVSSEKVTITVTLSGTSISNDKLDLGEFTKGTAKTITFSSSEAVNEMNFEEWTGTFSFYFSRN